MVRSNIVSIIYLLGVSEDVRHYSQMFPLAVTKSERLSIGAKRKSLDFLISFLRSSGKFEKQKKNVSREMGTRRIYRPLCDSGP